ncbi:SDR family oxidoreductase [Streptomyces sp. NA04227]|uniref:SDR family oxidoreductase n=1 Tax=Streptomyces sp. NA04227 TaxID=2742136 RepID=UPI001590C38B|nr:SDR family oxidoreductase [Streptomyces sp. NA04227]QKW06904.1 SDR family oxidoreductase [Streptomyces sp. NA04227]
MTTRLLTGVTGFVGGAIVLELLDRTEEPIYALVRGKNDDDAQQRLHDALIGMAEGYDRADLKDAIVSRTKAIRGDMTVDGCGADVSQLPQIDELWHSAASLRYEEEYREEIEDQNVGGTTNVLALARTLGVKTFNYVSTAYTAGSRVGEITEASSHDVEVANNCYEETKIKAERLVEAAASEMRIRILRPTIVIGHSVTRHGLNWSGMYGFARQMFVFKKHAARKLGTFLSHARIRLLAEPDTILNLVPVDFVARNAVTVALSDSPETYFHLGNSAGPTVRDTVKLITDLVGLREPLWESDTDGFTAIDEQLDSGMTFYRSYMHYDKKFDLSNTESVCGEGSTYAPMTREDLEGYLLYYMRGTLRGFDENAGTGRVLHETAA